MITFLTIFNLFLFAGAAIFLGILPTLIALAIVTCLYWSLDRATRLR
jgi:hypothetical protein